MIQVTPTTTSVYVPRTAITPLGVIAHSWSSSPISGLREVTDENGLPNKFKKRKNNMVVKPAWIKNHDSLILVEYFFNKMQSHLLLIQFRVVFG